MFASLSTVAKAFAAKKLLCHIPKASLIICSDRSLLEAASSSFSSSRSSSSSSSTNKSSNRTNAGPTAADALLTGPNDYYWHPHDDHVTAASIAQRRATGKLENAIESVLLADAVIRENLVERYGLTIHRIHLAKDRRTVFILWDANQGMAQQCQLALESNAFRLRRELAKNMKSKHTPYLEFRHNHLPPLQARVAATMELVEKEIAAEAAAAAYPAATAASTAGSGGPTAADIEAAIAHLEEATRPRQGSNME